LQQTVKGKIISRIAR